MVASFKIINADSVEVNKNYDRLIRAWYRILKIVWFRKGVTSTEGYFVRINL